MRTISIAAVGLLLLAGAACSDSSLRRQTVTPTSQPAIVWQKWSDDLFDRARNEKRFVILDLEAVWCHWCHVMDETTYRDEDVKKLIGQKYIAVRVDQDSRPDLSNRYEDFGWPATIVFAPDGSELAKRRGYLRPMEMSSMLQAIIDDPTPGPSVRAEEKVQPAESAALPVELRDKLIAQLKAAYDTKNGGWSQGYKFVDADVIEYCLSSGEADLKRMANQTLTAGLKLIDPAWGGVYQYSTDGDWDHPHFEKIMSYQADDLRTFARGYTVFHDPAYLKAAEDIHRFLRTFLTGSEGAFYTSQDADLVPGEHSAEFFALDDGARRTKGVPRVDTNVYSRENGWAIEALATLYGVTGDSATLQEALRAAEWLGTHRQAMDGSFRHGGQDAAGPYLGDTLAVGRAFLALYTATTDRKWLRRADSAARVIGSRFAMADGGFATAAPGGAFAPKPQVDENVSLARFANLLFAYTGNAADRKLAESAMKYLASPHVTGTRHWMVGGILLADRELASEPVHIVIVGPKSDPAAKAMYQMALSWPTSYKRVEWFDRQEGPLPRMDVDYPEMDKSAAFFCTGKACSLPVFSADGLLKKRDVGK